MVMSHKSFTSRFAQEQQEFMFIPITEEFQSISFFQFKKKKKINISCSFPNVTRELLSHIVSCIHSTVRHTTWKLAICVKITVFTSLNLHCGASDNLPFVNLMELVLKLNSLLLLLLPLFLILDLFLRQTCFSSQSFFMDRHVFDIESVHCNILGTNSYFYLYVFSLYFSILAQS